jgi:peptide deformylase
MFETMRSTPEVGLAAPQIGMPLQLAVIEDRVDFIDKLPPEHAAALLRTAVLPNVIVNPRLTLEPGDDSCARLVRPILQHEVDHLHGTLEGLESRFFVPVRS